MTQGIYTLGTLTLLFAIVLASPAFGAIDAGSDGSDGPFDPSVDSGVCTGSWDGANCVVDLSLAADAAWDAASPVAGRGVYDSAKWAVVFKYSTINIQPGVTVTFSGHPARAPVVWLVQGAAVIGGTVALDGSPQNGSLIVEGGPGGFRGGRQVVPSSASSAGFGPGGAQKSGNSGWGGSHVSLGAGGNGPTYGNDAVLPLRGGSGGSGEPASLDPAGGAGGGGALLIVADTTVTVNGIVRANGGSSTYLGTSEGGAGSGGAIRIVADTVGGSGQLRAQGGTNGVAGGAGRVRIEANSIALVDTAPAHTADTPCAGEGCTPTVWPAATAPAVRIVDIDSSAGEYADPHSRFDFPSQDVTMADPDPVTVTIETENVPLTWKVRLRITPREGGYTEVAASHLVGDTSFSTWTVDVAFPNAFAAVQARACDPAQGAPYCP